MSPPDQSSTLMMQECFRVQLGQLRATKSPLNISNIHKSATTSSLITAEKKYNLVSRHFTSRTNIIQLIYEKQVLLECLYTKESKAYGTIRVHNMVYDKLVIVRATHNEWKSFVDIQGSHSMNCPSDNTDTFTFEISLANFHLNTTEAKRILFAVCLKAKSQEFWDNNQGWNYVLDVFDRYLFIIIIFAHASVRLELNFK